jgi:hypothetical protein
MINQRKNAKIATLPNSVFTGDRDQDAKKVVEVNHFVNINESRPNAFRVWDLKFVNTKESGTHVWIAWVVDDVNIKGSDPSVSNAMKNGIVSMADHKYTANHVEESILA